MTPLSEALTAWAEQVAATLTAAGWAPEAAAQRAAALFPATAPQPTPTTTGAHQ